MLHPQLFDILVEARKIFPDSEIDLTTNGLLIPKMSDKEIRILEDNQITVHISGYKPVYSIIDRIQGKFDHTSINYTIIKRDKFFRFYRKDSDADENDIVSSHEVCPTRGCPELYRGHMMKCSALFAFDHFNKKFGTEYEIDKEKEQIDIHSDKIDGWDLKRLIDNPVPLCRYCDTRNLQYFTWHNEDKEKLWDYLLN